MALDEELLKIASMAYIKMGGQRRDETVMCISALLRNPESYEVVENERAEYVRTGKFPTNEEETKFKEAIALTSGLMRGTIEPVAVDFYFTQAQANKKKKDGTFPAVEHKGKVGRYNLYARQEMPVL